MKAARLLQPGRPLVVEAVAEPPLQANSVKVRVERALVPSYAATVFSGNLPFPLPVPYTPGPSCVGVVEEVSPEVIGIVPGERVLCGPYYSSPGTLPEPEEILIGWFGLTPGSGPLLERWKNGGYADKAVYPVSNVTPLGNGDPGKLIRLAPLCISYGALLQGNLTAGQTLLVNGATGHLGSGCVLLGLALGASRVVAVGRNAQVLEQLQGLDPKRVVPLQVPEDPDKHAAQVAERAGRVDVVIDALGYVKNPGPTLAGIKQLRRGGTAVFLGGVLADIPISYIQVLASRLTIRGSFMHPQSAVRTVLSLVEGGLVDLNRLSVLEIKLGEVNQAIARAGELRGLACCVLVPGE